MNWLSGLAAALLLAPCIPAADAGGGDRFLEAIRNDSLSTLKALIRNPGPNTPDPRGTTPLMLAAASGSLDAMKLLIAAGASVNAKNAFGITALMWCATDEAKVRLLVSKGADLNARSKQGRTPLLIAASSDGASPIVRFMLEKGADPAKADADPVTTPLTAAAMANDTPTFRILLGKGADLHSPAGAVSLIFASGHGNLEMMRMLLAGGVDVNSASPPVTEAPVKNGDIAIGLLTPLISAAAFGGFDAVKMLVDAKANVNAQDVRGMTPLMLAVALDRPDPRVVRLLLASGADRAIKSKAGETAADWAFKFNHPEVLKALDLKPAPVEAALQANPVPLREAVQRSAELLQRTSGSFFVSGGCSSCHSHNLAAIGLHAARAAGIRVDETAAATHAGQTLASWAVQDQALMLRIDAPGGHNMVANAVLELAAEQVKPSLMTDAMVHNIAAQQQVNGAWHNDIIARPPMSDGDFTHTAIAIRSLALYGAPGRKAEFADRIRRGAAWLQQTPALTTEDQTMQVLGVKWAGAGQDKVDRLARGLMALQRADGGWAQTPYLASDAYATGESLVALHEAGVPASDRAYRKGVEFLLRTQMADGSWHVKSRAPKFQPYFQSGFPYDHDQWISMAAAGWATAALSYALPDPRQTIAAR